MKRFLKSRKGWIAFFLAFLLVAATCITSSDAFLWATGEDETTVSEETDNGSTEEVMEVDVEEEEPEVEENDTEGTEKVEEETNTEETKKTGEVSDGEEEQAPEDEETPEEVTEETPEIVEETATYGYAVYYYYDEVEDESARVEDEGALGDAIFTSAEEEVVHDGKDYVLDHVENEEGTIGEDAEQNVVKVYYVLAEEEVEKVERSVKVVSSLKGVDTVEEGTSITLTAKLTGFDDVEYEIQWQRSEDGTDWEDVDGANDTEYTFDITEETEGYLWRVSVSTSEA